MRVQPPEARAVRVRRGSLFRRERGVMIRDASLYLNQTKTDAIAAPFQDTEPEVVSATLSVTNLYTGSEPTPTTGEEVPPGYVEDDDVYWLRYQ